MFILRYVHVENRNALFIFIFKIKAIMFNFTTPIYLQYMYVFISVLHWKEDILIIITYYY